VNITVAAVDGVTIIGGTIGEWHYFILGSLVEALLLAVVVTHAWTWPRHDEVLPSPARRLMR